MITNRRLSVIALPKRSPVIPPKIVRRRQTDLYRDITAWRTLSVNMLVRDFARSGEATRDSMAKFGATIRRTKNRPLTRITIARAP